jgi:[glutamine synthetase] adenylyltransferase / [glutamine synthetase]-adenylyl-L-tyrosine phosphorylase
VNELARRVIESLRTGEPRVQDLARAGAPAAAEAAAALGAAARDRDLAARLEHWCPTLIASADPGAGARRLAALADAHRERQSAPLAATAALARVLGNSHFLGRWLLREPGWADDLAHEPAPTPAPVAANDDWPALRRAKYRGLLRITARDGARPFDDGLAELSDLADDILRRALAIAADGREAPALFALGKLGGRELNFSSDVDLYFVCEAPPDERGHEARESAAAVVRELRRRLDERTDEGFAYRVDLDLRPEGDVGALVRGVEGTLGYYELRGAEWERQMLLRLRYLAGAPEAARAFERGIEPFVYRRAIDPGVIDAVRAMKTRIETERREHGRDVDSNLKEGPGGIRDVEFTVQALQLFHAGRRPELRTGNVLAAVAALAHAQILPEGSAEVLAEGYRWLRRAEHALQLAEEQQTAQLPREPDERTALARRMGYADATGEEAARRFEADLARTRAQVREQFEALVLGSRAA